MEIGNVILLAYYLTLGVLALYGLHRALLLRLRRRHAAAPTTPRSSDRWPLVTVQLPLYNEVHVGPRLLDAVCRLDYPSDRLEIQVLDDSDDETAEVMRRRCERWRRRGRNVSHLRRAERGGYKAGALAAGLEQARGELVAVFDADFVPPSSFLRRALPWFGDPRVGMVQARWEHLNRRESLLTRVQAVLLDGHFVIEHAARHRSGRLFNFNGTAGVWRRAAIESVGGWQHDTLTEDLDLSYRAQLAGWRFVYLPELAVPSELPASISALKSQQHRWAKGSIQTARKLLGRVLGSREPWWRKLEACVHLTANGCYVLMVLLALLIVPAMLERRGADQWKMLAIDLPLFLIGTVSIALYYLESQRLAPRGERRTLTLLPSVFALGIGLSISNASAVLSGLVRRGGAFVRTPKRSSTAPRAGDAGRRSYAPARSRTVAIEAAFALYFAAAALVALRLGLWLALPFFGLFLHGYGWVSILHWRERHAGPRRPRERRAGERNAAIGGALAASAGVD